MLEIWVVFCWLHKEANLQAFELIFIYRKFVDFSINLQSILYKAVSDTDQDLQQKRTLEH